MDIVAGCFQGMLTFSRSCIPNLDVPVTPYPQQNAIRGPRNLAAAIPVPWKQATRFPRVRIPNLDCSGQVANCYSASGGRPCNAGGCTTTTIHFLLCWSSNATPYLTRVELPDGNCISAVTARCEQLPIGRPGKAVDGVVDLEIREHVVCQIPHPDAVE
jgi:hypothetical protein